MFGVNLEMALSKHRNASDESPIAESISFSKIISLFSVKCLRLFPINQ